MYIYIYKRNLDTITHFLATAMRLLNSYNSNHNPGYFSIGNRTRYKLDNVSNKLIEFN